MNKPLSVTQHRAALALSALAVAALAACSTVPDRNPALEQARSHLQTVRTQSQVATLAPAELQRAADALARADQAHASGAVLAQVDHLAYLTKQRINIAQETAADRASVAITASAGAERDRMRLAQRTQEADTAQTQLAASQRSNARTSQELAAVEQDRARTGQALAASQQANAQKTAELAQADAMAAADRARLNDLQAQLRDLNARQTERGIVVTLGDVLFDTGAAQLKPEGGRSMAKLAEFLQRNPQRRAAIEGYTDSVGSTANNQSLSDRRANTVKNALTQLGVGAERLSTQAFGEASPVADNNTAAGRQMNRRVEVLFAPAAGDVMLK